MALSQFHQLELCEQNNKHIIVRSKLLICKFFDLSCHGKETIHFTDVWFSFYAVEREVRVASSPKKVS